MQYKSLLIGCVIGLNIGLTYASDSLPNEIWHNHITHAIHNIDDDWGTNLTSYANTCKANTKAVNDFREEIKIPKNALIKIPSGSEITTAVLTNKWHRKWSWNVSVNIATLAPETLKGFKQYNPTPDILERLELLHVNLTENRFWATYINKDKVLVTFDVPYLETVLLSNLSSKQIKVNRPAAIIKMNNKNCIGKKYVFEIVVPFLPDGLNIICKQENVSRETSG
jgi:hypothetical protein